MNKSEKAQYILDQISKLFPDAKSELSNWNTPFQFLVCIILSAQTTDKQVNKVTAELFSKYPTAQDLAISDINDVGKIIGSVNFHRNKSKHIVAAAQKLVSEFNSEIPVTVKELMLLPGVGRKTANVFLNDLYEKNEGIGADTHIMRVSQRLGLSKNTSPEKIAKDLEKIYKQKDWHRVNSLFVLYGRYYCKAKIPGESKCIFKDLCSYCKDK